MQQSFQDLFYRSALESAEFQLQCYDAHFAHQYECYRASKELIGFYLNVMILIINGVTYDMINSVNTDLLAA